MPWSRDLRHRRNAVLATERVAFLVPITVGVKMTLIVHDCPGKSRGAVIGLRKVSGVGSRDTRRC